MLQQLAQYPRPLPLRQLTQQVLDPLPERIAFLNRGQGWVVKKLREMMPRVRDDALHRDLAEMLESHVTNIARANEALESGGR